MHQKETDESGDDDEEESEDSTKARARPPASFYSMDFLDELEAAEDELIENETKVWRIFV